MTYFLITSVSQDKTNTERTSILIPNSNNNKNNNKCVFLTNPIEPLWKHNHTSEHNTTNCQEKVSITYWTHLESNLYKFFLQELCLINCITHAQIKNSYLPCLLRLKGFWIMETLNSNPPSAICQPSKGSRWLSSKCLISPNARTHAHSPINLCHRIHTNFHQPTVQKPFFMNGQKVVHWLCVFVLKPCPLHWYEVTPLQLPSCVKSWFFFFPCLISPAMGIVLVVWRYLARCQLPEGLFRKMWKIVFSLPKDVFL